MSPFVANLREYISHARSVPIDQDRAEVRIYAAMLTAVAGYFLILEPIFELIAVPQSPLYRAASLTPSVWLVVAAFVMCLAGLLPHFYSLVFRPDTLSKKWPRSIAAKVSVGASFTWIYLTERSTSVDLGAVEWTYALRAFLSIALAFGYGFSVNAQQGREILRAKSN